MSEITPATNLDMALQLVILGILLYGWYLVKSKRSLVQHGWILVLATVLNTISVLGHMVPALVSESNGTSELLVEPDLLLIAHVLLGTVAELLALYLVVRWLINRRSVRKCMGKRLMIATNTIWILALVLGAITYISNFLD